MSDATAAGEAAGRGWFRRLPWGRGDLVALAIWTSAVVWIFLDAVTLRGALFYFDITEINYPYRHFFAEELRAGRFSRWCPWLYCGMPLYSESQAGYLHPLKYLFYPWMETWKALNLDTVFSVWLAGAGAYGWLRRHVGPAGALAGAALFGMGGFTWAHIVHTSMINALASVPFVIWGLEWSWETGRWRGVVLGGFALACQVFAGHLQDVLLTSGIVGVYALHRAVTEPPRGRLSTLSMPVAMVVLGILLSAVQWVPSKDLLDRSPRAGGLSYAELTYGSWHPELLPTLVMREAYGTRARDTDWMDGFYPYHEMNAYLGLMGLCLAVIGAGGPGLRDRWANLLVVLAAIGGILMLGKFTFLYDHAHKIPVLGSSREPVRFQLWVSLAVAGLAALGVERLGRPGEVRIRYAAILALVLIAASIPILLHVYTPVWTNPKRWAQPYHIARYRWLGREFVSAAVRDLVLIVVGLGIVWRASRSSSVARRRSFAWILPLLVLADLVASHALDVPTVPPDYWTSPPPTVVALRSDPGFIRVFGMGDKSSGEPGYASETVDFLAARDPLDWSLPAAWGLASAKGETPMIPRRLVDYFDGIREGRLDVESVSHVVTGRNQKKKFQPSTPVGAGFIYRNLRALPRARLMGRPHYADGPAEAIAALETLGPETRSRLVVEDPDRPLPPTAEVEGTARIAEDLPERVTVETESASPAYLMLADTFDPGWSATLDGRPVAIRPAYVAFRAVALPAGAHRVVFTYRPVGFLLGLCLSGLGLVLAVSAWLCPGLRPSPGEHADLASAGRMRARLFAIMGLVIVASAIQVGPGPRIGLQGRWRNSVHTFTWGAGIEAMKANRR